MTAISVVAESALRDSERGVAVTVAFVQKLGCRAILQENIRNDVEVRSMAGSVVLYDCSLSL